MLEVSEVQGLSLVLLGVLPLESFNTTRGVYEFLLPGEERMTFRTDFQMDFGLGRASTERFSARAFDHRVDVIRMNVGLH